MPIYTEKNTPYEFLCRWDDEGKLSGAHVGFRNVVQKDGVDISSTRDDVQSVAIGTAAGFPLSDVLALVQSGFSDQGAAFMATVNANAAAQTASENAQTAADAAKVSSDTAQAAASASADALEAANARLAAAQAEAARLALIV
jgi:hypothetical protein